RPVDKQIKEGLLNNLVQTIALGEAARKRGLDKRKDIQELLALAQDNLLANELIKEEVINKVNLDEEQVKKYYEKNLTRFKTPDQVRVGSILIKMNAPPSEDDKKKAREKAEMILKKIKAGEDFARLAEEFSDDPASKTKGGDLGFIPRSQQAAPFEKAAEQAVLALQPGEISEALETPFGYRLVQIGEEKKGEIQSFESIKDKVRAMALEEVKKEKIKTLVDQALKETGAQIFQASLE
ncbi:MAG: peptidylprolyl isomerase, partial [Deltaproteobacteria bacterium]|nr:peptidylprolyl isomerase [Deltaproteobacteria bacterium]